MDLTDLTYEDNNQKLYIDIQEVRNIIMSNFRNFNCSCCKIFRHTALV